jgi:hypothetical protein
MYLFIVVRYLPTCLLTKVRYPVVCCFVGCGTLRFDDMLPDMLPAFLIDFGQFVYLFFCAAENCNKSLSASKKTSMLGQDGHLYEYDR